PARRCRTLHPPRWSSSPPRSTSCSPATATPPAPSTAPSEPPETPSPPPPTPPHRFGTLQPSPSSLTVLLIATPERPKGAGPSTGARASPARLNPQDGSEGGSWGAVRGPPRRF